MPNYEIRFNKLVEADTREKAQEIAREIEKEAETTAFIVGLQWIEIIQK